MAALVGAPVLGSGAVPTDSATQRSADTAGSCCDVPGTAEEAAVPCAAGDGCLDWLAAHAVISKAPPVIAALRAKPGDVVFIAKTSAWSRSANRLGALSIRLIPGLYG